MNDTSAHTGRSSRTSGGVCSERSRDAGCAATFAELDVRLEVRDRLAAIIDELDGGDAGTALLNVRWLLDDLDGAAA